MDEALLKRVMPHSIQAEQSVIGAMIMDKDAISVACETVGLTKDDFYNKNYGALFEAIAELYNEGKPVDDITIAEKIGDKNVPKEIASRDSLREIIQAVPTSANIKNYAEIVYEKAMLRRMIKMTEEIANNCYSESDTVGNLLDDTEQRVFKLLQSKGSSDYVPISEVVREALDRIELASASTDGITGISTGFADLDRRTSGLQNSDLILVAARPSMGKTAFVLNLAQNMFKNGKTVLIFSLEMPKVQLVNRLLAQEGRIDGQKIMSGRLDEKDYDSLIEAADVVGHSRLIIEDKSGITIPEMRSKCRKYKLEHNIDIVMIDYLQLMNGSGRSESRQQEISEISRALKGLARELNVPVIALSQLSRAVESRTDHRPMLSDLRESGAIEQDADIVMFLYRDDYYNPESPDKGVTEIITAKQRNGPVGTDKLMWLSNFMKFVGYEASKKKD
ncbi:MAG: replicative DNA helicase [Parasporobacterium sp.]|nr:replicative DNA helicase [Parasporobacterium sp.]